MLPRLEAGALVLADKGVCCIDEFSSIRAGDRAAIHEAMEQQTLSVAKAGLVCKLSARTTVVAATNPRGKYDRKADLSVNTSLPPPLLSRFDVVLVIEDDADVHWDRAVSANILNMHLDPRKGALDPFASDDDDDGGGDGGDGDGDGERRKRRRRRGPHSAAALRPPPWATDKLRKYVAHVKASFRPTLGDGASQLLSTYYSKQRLHSGAGRGRATIRMLESLVRLTQAHARLMYRTVASTQDAVVAVLLVDKSMMDTAVFAETPPIPELTVTPDSDAYYRYQEATVLEKLDLAPDDDAQSAPPPGSLVPA